MSDERVRNDKGGADKSSDCGAEAAWPRVSLAGSKKDETT